MKKILIIEDDLQLQLIYQDLLKNLQVEILLAITASQGLHLAKTYHPDLILLDLMLPSGFTGLDLLKELKGDQELVNIPVIVLSNLDSERAKAMDIGASEYLVKANTLSDDVVKTIEKYLL